MNTKIKYLYRDNSNYKTYPETDVIVEGKLSMSDFKSALHMDEMFIPHDFDLPALQSQFESYPNRKDHIWHQLFELEPTSRKPSVEMNAEEIRDHLKNIAENGWNESDAFDCHDRINSLLG